VDRADDVANWDNSGNRRILREVLRPDEQVVEVVEASRGRLRLGLLALAPERLIYVEERAIAKPVIWEFLLAQIEHVRFDFGPVTSVMTIDLRDGASRRFRSLMPRERAEALAHALEAGTGTTPDTQA
jgi:hypothetical protein